MRPPLPLPPADPTGRVPGMLLIRTGDDDSVWEDVLSRMGELPGRCRPDGTGPDGADRGDTIPRRLVVAHEPGWRGADADEVAEALAAAGTWTPDLVLLTDDRTTVNEELRPLLAFAPLLDSDDEDEDQDDDQDDDEDQDEEDGDEEEPEVAAFWITPRQAAMAYLVLHQPGTSYQLEQFAEDAPTEPEWEVEDGDEVTEDALYEPAGAALETSDDPPLYTRPQQPLPLLGSDRDLLVRTDFGDDAAWAALVAAVSAPYPEDEDGYGDAIEFVDDPAFEGATPEQVMAQTRNRGSDGIIADVVLLADAVTLREPGNRVLVMPMMDDIGLHFRVDADTVGSMLPNLGLANMDLDEFRE
ncbi:hypothetical protein HCN52_12515 [Streptomyces bohaiensis]|uniref:DUF6924 domain-containing protein n=2 Tax=Streptomyces bohaiensis TaxID=1431344 RepID=A0ABX1C9C8_9ACTN|nr:hypothetical protein [Streptomyces bohaiensis]